ncbi:MAG: DUF4331 domain-containing protein [Synechococcales bacterium]|nr:DUF4331 domain-containing protein [Synechococcales bacterium]
MKKIILFGLGLLVCGVAATVAIVPRFVIASDHDDGETSTKGRNVSLTDLYVFQEKTQNANAKDGDLIFVMGTNPRSLARQQYYFSDKARYEFHVTQVSDVNARPTGQEDMVLRFEFEAPKGNAQQRFQLTTFAKGRAIGTTRGHTTPLASNPNAAPVINQGTIAGYPVTVFAGLREDPFFFDVEQFFRVRAGALGIGPQVEFRSANQALDFAKGYNFNAIVVRVPRNLLQTGSQATVFDVWQTISVRDPRSHKFNQVERLGRPAVNEGLVVTNAFLNAFNSIPPSADLSNAAAPVRAEAKQTLLSLGNSSARADALLTAFLPDVMRIDTKRPSGYLNATNSLGAPITGRLLLDDTVDQTLSVLTGNPNATDNVSYVGAVGNPAQGHDPLVSSFPYLALPN